MTMSQLWDSCIVIISVQRGLSNGLHFISIQGRGCITRSLKDHLGKSHFGCCIITTMLSLFLESGDDSYRHFDCFITYPIFHKKR